MTQLMHMSGAGNTFLVGQHPAELASPLPADLVRSMIAEHPRTDGSPIEGVLLVTSAQAGSFTADYYNPDGSHGMMCGNGSRCVVRFAVDHGVDPVNGLVSFTLNGAPYTAHLHDDETISIDFAPPLEEHAYPAGSLDGVEFAAYYVNVNSDHVVIRGPRDASRPVVSTLRHHQAFPRGVNVNMVDIEPPSTAHLATFERGVEAITGACGTGAIATSIALWREHETGDQVHIIPPSGRPLQVIIHHEGDVITAMTLRGDARYDH